MAASRIDATGHWTFTANSAFDALNVGDSITDSFVVAAVDGTTTSVAVTITGTNDAAVLSSAAVTLTETDAALTTSGDLTVTDVDGPAAFVAQTGTVGTYGSFAIDATGHWTFTANSAFDASMSVTASPIALWSPQSTEPRHRWP